MLICVLRFEQHPNVAFDFDRSAEKRNSRLVRSSIFKQILASVREIGLIEPLVVYPQEGKGFLLLDGHLRLEALKILGSEEVNCIVSTDDESYTYNKRVNHIPPVAQHFMLMEAIKERSCRGADRRHPERRCRRDRRRVQMLDGICPEVVEMLRDRKLSLDLFPVLRKMKPIGQIATVELMVLRNDYSVAFAKTRLAISPPALLAKTSTARQQKANADAADALLGEDTDGLIQNLKAIEETYGTDVLTLTVTCAYLDRLFSEEKITQIFGTTSSWPSGNTEDDHLRHTIVSDTRDIC